MVKRSVGNGSAVVRWSKELWNYEYLGVRPYEVKVEKPELQIGPSHGRAVEIETRSEKVLFNLLGCEDAPQHT